VSVLTDNIFSVIIKAMTLDDLDYSDQHNAAQQAALFQHEQLITMNTAAKEAYTTITPLSHRMSNFTGALNNVANMASSQGSPDPMLKQQHQLVLPLLCLQKYDHGELSIPDKLNTQVELILKSGMKLTGPMLLKRALARFIANITQKVRQPTRHSLCHRGCG
jgi:hypothetical protein